MATSHLKPQVTNYVTSASPILPIVGRDRELTLVRNQYEIAKCGRTRILLLAGEPGIGKTRLLDEVATLALQDGVAVLRGGASNGEGMPPYLPFLEALGGHIQAAPLDQLQEQLGAVSHILVNILPELTDRLGDLLIPHALPSEQARFRLQEAIGIFLEAIGASHVLLLTLDDLQWADSASLDLLCHIARRQPNARLLILGAYRDSETSCNPALAHCAAELSRQRILTTMTLHPFSANEIESLAINSLGGSLSSPLYSTLYTQSEGNPFFAEELLHSWIERGIIIQEQDHWIATRPIEDTLPPSVVGALRQRFTRLSAGVIDHLRVASIIGRTFELWLLAGLQDQEVETLEESLQEAVQARLVRIEQRGNFVFCHDKIRECLYAEVSSTRRQRLHSSIGHILEARYMREETMRISQLAELAFHFVRSNDQERGIKYSQQAAEQALRASAAMEAIAYLREALALLRPDDRRRGDVLLSLGAAALLAGKAAEAETTYASALQCLMQADDLEVAAQAAHGLGLAQWWQDKRTDACRTLEYALELLGERRCEERVKALSDLSILITIFLKEQEKGVGYARQALEIAQSLGDSCLEVMASRVVTGMLSIQSGELSTAVQPLEGILKCAEESEVIARRENLLPELAQTLLLQADVELRQMNRRRFTRASNLLNQALALFEEMGMAESMKRVHDRLNSLSVRTNRQQSRSILPQHLTEREIAVLKLVAEGRNNRQIAQALSISEKTVANHLSHIYIKTQSENRAAATAFALRHRLV